eukprot:Nk52_evm34s2309 gene=Nk52_evmTU34s2309
MSSSCKYKNQDFEALHKQCKETNTLFEDPEFPANDSSLWYTKPEGVKAKLYWKRPQELVEHPALFTDGFDPEDVTQGNLGNCWFVASLSSLALHTQALHHIMPDGESVQWFLGESVDAKANPEYQGIFRVKFYRFGQWTEVVIDDRLPAVRKANGQFRLIFTHSKTDHEFWSSLLEKAYAKLAGNYHNLISGRTSDALTDFTGGVCEELQLGEFLQPLEGEDEKEMMRRKAYFFQDLVFAKHKSSILTTSISIESEGDIEKRTENGLVMGHAYGITDVVKLDDASNPNTIHRLFRLRNPWGEKEWTGKWSDNSSEWKQYSGHDLKRLGIEFEDDGEFFMDIDSVCKNFTTLIVCRLFKTQDSPHVKDRSLWDGQLLYGEWKGDLMGGCVNYDTFLNNPQYILDLSSPAILMVELSQKDRRSEDKDNETIGFSVHKLPDGWKKRVHKIPKRVGYVTYSNGRAVFSKLDLDKGTYMIIPSTFEPNRQLEFLLRIFTDIQTHVEEAI